MTVSSVAQLLAEHVGADGCLITLNGGVEEFVLEACPAISRGRRFRATWPWEDGDRGRVERPTALSDWQSNAVSWVWVRVVAAGSDRIGSVVFFCTNERKMKRSDILLARLASLASDRILRAYALRKAAPIAARHVAMMQHLMVATVWVPGWGGMCEVNPAAAALLSIPVGGVQPDVLAAAMADLVARSEDPEQLRAQALQRLRDGQRFAEWRWKIEKPALQILDVSSIPIPGGDRLWWFVDHTAEFELKTELALRNVELANANERLRQLASSCSLTGLSLRRVFFETGETLVALAQRLKSPLSMLMIDIDHFKDVNDTYGHATGDAVLCACAAQLTHRRRASDVVSRLGGEEFAILLPNTNLNGAMLVAEEIRARIEATFVVVDTAEVRVTASIGVASLAAETLQALCARADVAVYKAKHQGRNRVCAYASVDPV